MKFSFYPITKNTFFVYSTFGKDSNMIPKDSIPNSNPVYISVTDAAGTLISQFTIPNGFLPICKLRTNYLRSHLGDKVGNNYIFIINNDPTIEVPRLGCSAEKNKYSIGQYTDSSNHIKLTMIPSKDELLLRDLFSKIRSNEESVFYPLIEQTINEMRPEVDIGIDKPIEDRIIDTKTLYFPYLSQEGEVVPGLLTEIICEYNDIDPRDLYDYISVEDPESKARLEPTNSKYTQIVDKLTKIYPISDYREEFNTLMADFIKNYVGTLPEDPDDYEFDFLVRPYLE